MTSHLKNSKLFALLPALALILGVAGPASAGILPVNGTLTVAIGTLPPISVTGSATAAFSTGGGALGSATVPAGMFPISQATAISPPLLGLLGAVGVFGSNAAGDLLGGVTTGTMALSASAQLFNAAGTLPVAFIPLSVIGVGGTQPFSVFGALIGGVISANPFQLAPTTVTGSLAGTPQSQVGTGSDARTAGGAGSLTLVSPTTVGLGALGALATLITLELEYGAGTVPEPGAMLLVGSGVAGLLLIGRRKLRR